MYKLFTVLILDTHEVSVLWSSRVSMHFQVLKKLVLQHNIGELLTVCLLIMRDVCSSGVPLYACINWDIYVHVHQGMD